MFRTRAKKLARHYTSLEQLGWYCTALFLGAYFLVSAGIISSGSIFYQLLNLAGASGYSYYAYRRKVYPSVLANTIWALIGIVAITTILL